MRGAFHGVIVGTIAVTACTHHPNLARFEVRSDKLADVYVSSAYHRHGGLRHAVVETVTDVGHRCAQVDLVRYDYTVQGTLARKVSERRACGLVVLRTIERYDPTQRTRVRETLRDDDGDGTFELEWRERTPFPGVILSPVAGATPAELVALLP